MDLKQAAAIGKRTEEGDWLDIPDFPGTRIKTRGLDTADFRRARVLGLAKLRARDKTPENFEEAKRRVDAQAVVEVCIQDWEGFTENGVAIPFTKEKALQLIAEPMAGRVYIATFNYAAARVGSWDGADEDEDIKN